MKRYYLYVILFFWTSFALGQIQTKVTPQKAALGETIRLTLTSDMPAQAGLRPDLSPLKQLFQVIGTEQSMSYSVTNGSAHAISQWVILLNAKQKGTLTIPAIQIGQDSSQPQQVEIVDAMTKDDDNAGDVVDSTLLLKTEVSHDHPYINQQVIYTVKLYHTQRLVDANYQPPTIEHALLFPLGDGQSYQSVLNGQIYAVEEQQYAVFPQKSGTLELVAPSLHAMVYNDGPQRVSAKAKTITLNVKPAPDTFTGQQWFPAKQVKLAQTYSTQDNFIIEGNTLVRTVTLQAIGLPAQLLPNLNFMADKGVGVYPEKPNVDNVIRQNELVSKAVIKVTYLFNQAGPVTIPALSVKWFNTTTGREEETILPPKQLTIIAKDTLTHSSVSSKADKAVEPASTVKPSDLRPKSQDNSPLLPWVIVAICALGWIMTILCWLLSKKGTWFKGNKRVALKRLHDACMQNQPTIARNALLQWAVLQWPDANIMNITDLTRVVHDAALKKQLLILSHALYGQDGKISWRGDALWHCVAKHRTIKNTHKNKGSQLPPINPF